MRDDLPDWLDTTEDEARPAGRTRLRALLAAAVLPWVVVAGLVMVGPWQHAPQARQDRSTPDTPAAVTDDRPGPSEARPGDEAGIPTHSTPPPPPGTGDDTPGSDGLPVTELRGGWRLATGDGDVAALATVIARAWLTGVDPTLAVGDLDPPDGSVYAEHLVVEAVEHPGPGAAVATLLAVVLDRDGGDLHAGVRRLAVPITIDADGPRPAGSPWWLPGPDLTAATLDRDVVDDPQEQLAAADALVTAGFSDVVVHRLWRSELWPLVVEVSATTPEGMSVDGSVWLRQHLDGLVVAGAGPQVQADPDDDVTEAG